MKRKIALILVLALWLGLTAIAWVKPSDEMSDSERRNLAQFPELTVNTLLSGQFMTGFADYAVDQFPIRDGFRTLNAILTRYGLGQKDNNGIYIHDGFAVKMEYPLNQGSLDYASDRFGDLYQQYLAGSDCRILFTVVPDKNFYLSGEAGMLAMDYDALYDDLEETLTWAEFVDIRDALTVDCYYRTDTHWRQEKLLGVMEKLTDALQVSAPNAELLTQEQAKEDFYGVYYGQAAMPMAPERLNYLTWEGWEDCVVYTHDTGTTSQIYDESKLDSKDPYEFFLSGSVAVQTIENPNAATDRELVIFRDSFGSSIAPLLCMEYAKVTLIDTRYVFPDAVGQFVEFENQDVLFLYSTLVLNSSSALRK